MKENVPLLFKKQLLSRTLGKRKEQSVDSPHCPIRETGITTYNLY